MSTQTYKGQVTSSTRPFPDANQNAVVHTSAFRGDINTTHFKNVTGPLTLFSDGAIWDEGTSKPVSVDAGNLVGTPRPK